jgi:hypothetical protein
MFTFKYSGRELLTTTQLLETRPDLKDLYVYDTTLTTGSLLYSCSGGVGITKEPFIVDMHKLIKTSTCVSSLRSVMDSEFGGAYTRRKYLSSRERFNEKGAWELTSSSERATLYLLWVAGGFRHRYRDRGYDAPYSPSSIDYEGLATASRQSREKNLLFRREDFSTMSESIINDNIFVHLYLPTEFGVYGAGFRWNVRTLETYVRIANELGSLGHKVCVSALFERRGRIFRDYRNYFPTFHHLVLPGFKVSELTSKPEYSEIHFFNF